MLASWSQTPRSSGHIFYDKLQAVLIAADFGRFVEERVASKYAPRRGRTSPAAGAIFACC
jgi:transposase